MILDLGRCTKYTKEKMLKKRRHSHVFNFNISEQ